jgi:DNA-directed RNA polymerase II subunit RPB1
LTYGLSPAITGPYNADFDGDEMNIFVPQSLQAQTELEEIADVKKQIITPSKSVTVYGIVQDGLLGAYNLTDDKVRINWRDAMNMISYTTFDDFEKLEKNREYTGAELFSMIIPPKITMKVGDTEIVKGKLVSGKVGKNILGAMKKNNILQYIWDEYGEDATRNFIDNCQRLVNNFNLWNGFTAGVGDAKVSNEAKLEIAKCIEGIMNKVEIEITSAENNPGYMDVKTFEEKIFMDVNVVRDKVSDITLGKISPDNKFGIMYMSGSKGGKNNLGQMIGCVGLQAFEGGFMPKMYNDRTLCYFHENDDRAKSRGLCFNPYIGGLKFSELCYHTKAGRAGLIEQVVKTSETGYAQRKLIKTMEDVMVKYDRSVRVGKNQILQLIFGGNGADTTVQYEYDINMLGMSNAELEKTFKFDQDQLKNLKDFSASDNDDYFTFVKNARDFIRRNYVKAHLDHKEISTKFMLSVNLKRVITSITSDDNVSNSSKSQQLTPKYIIDSINDMLSIHRTPLVQILQKEKENPPALAIKNDYDSKIIFRTAMHNALNPKAVITKYKMTKEIFDRLIKTIENNFNDNLIEPGEMNGIIAAQSLGEAVTQMTLNAFHHSGIASLTHSTAGVPRINELISASKNPKTPQMFVYLNSLSRGSREIAHKIGSYLKKTTVGDIRNDFDVYYDPLPHGKNSIMEKDGVSEPYYSKKLSKSGCQASIENLPWLFRIVIDKEKMLDNEVTLMEIKNKLCLWWERRHFNNKKKKEKINLLKKITSFAVLSNDDNDIEPIIHIRFNVRDIEKADSKKGKQDLKFNRNTLDEFSDMIDKFKLKGIDHIETVNTISKELFRNITDGDSMKESEEQVIYTSGVNLKDIRYINGIDPYRTYSDDIIEIFSTFGIKFTRNRLLGEFMKAYVNAGNEGIGPQHISLLADVMCYNGNVISADRHGMKNSNIAPLAKGSFEKTIDVILSSAVFNESDKMTDVSSILHIGAVYKGGTGLCKVLLDTDMIKNSEYTESSRSTSKVSLPSNTIANAIMDDDKGEEIYIP